MSSELPPQYSVLEELAAARETRVVRARLVDEERVLRIAGPGADAESLSELAVLAAVEHPGLARLLDHGLLPGGATWVAREWIPGRPLSDCRDRSPEDLGRLVCQLCPALEQKRSQPIRQWQGRRGNGF